MFGLIVAEDEELFRKELSTATDWEKSGFLLVGAAKDGEEAMDLVRSVRPDAVVTDVRMPVLDGLGLLAAIQELPEEQRPLVVMLSGHSEFEYARKAMRLGAFDYLMKPLDDAELEGTMTRLADALAERSRKRALDEVAAADPAIAFFAEYAPSGPRDAADSYVERAVAEIRERYLVDLSAGDVAAPLGISGGHLARIFRTKTGLTFAEYLASYRMKRACELLRDPTIRVGEVADLVGYLDQRHFAHVFRKYVGTTPTGFREGRFAAGRRGGDP
ncbi:MAG: response regulator [Spirochaetes bacterium]|nr:response regulator [Spirochaetota bacterium]